MILSLFTPMAYGIPWEYITLIQTKNSLDLSNAWWRHQMETCSALLAFCAGNSPVTGEFPAQRPVTRSFDVFFYLRLNQQSSKQWRRRWFEMPSRSLWRHCNGIWWYNSNKGVIPASIMQDFVEGYLCFPKSHDIIHVRNIDTHSHIYWHENRKAYICPLIYNN